MASLHGCVNPWSHIDQKYEICRNITAAKEVTEMEMFYNKVFDGEHDVS